MDARRESRDVLLAWINRRLEVISEAQHRLSLDRSVLQEQATRLRLGAAPADVETVLEHAGLGTSRRRRRVSGLGVASGDARRRGARV